MKRLLLLQVWSGFGWIGHCGPLTQGIEFTGRRK